MAQQKIDPTWAWQEYKPTKDVPWNLKRVGHLYRRAAFGANHSELQAGLKAGPEKTVSQLLAGGSKAKQNAFETDSDYMAKSISEANNADQLSAWWLHRMLNTHHPLQERLTLFWHDHFATSNNKVNNTAAMIGQYRLLYKHAQGNYAQLLRDMSYDPAMLIWLDAQTSVKGKPNENYARELMELFSLGLGHYTEEDIRQAARAFTGWSVQNGEAVFNAAQHDETEKSVLGRKGNFKPDDIVRICLDQEACSYFIARKTYNYFVNETETPDNELLKPLADAFRKSGFDYGAMIETVLRSNLFFAEDSYRACIKSPVDFVMGILRGLECKGIQATALSAALAELGQRVMFPPSVAGWDGGTAWLNAQTLLFRNNLALALTSTEDLRFSSRCDPVPAMEKYKRESDESMVDFFLEVFLQGDIEKEKRDTLLSYLKESKDRPAPAFWTEEDVKNNRIRTLCHLVLALPEYQLD